MCVCVCVCVCVFVGFGAGQMRSLSVYINNFGFLNVSIVFDFGFISLILWVDR